MDEGPSFDLAPPGSARPTRTPSVLLEEGVLLRRARASGRRSFLAVAVPVAMPLAVILVLEAPFLRDPPWLVPVLMVPLIVAFFAVIPFIRKWAIQYWGWDLPRLAVGSSAKAEYEPKLKRWSAWFWYKKNEPQDVAGHMDHVCGFESRPWPWESPDPAVRDAALDRFLRVRRQARREQLKMWGWTGFFTVLLLPLLVAGLFLEMLVPVLAGTALVGVGGTALTMPLQRRVVERWGAWYREHALHEGIGRPTVKESL